MKIKSALILVVVAASCVAARAQNNDTSATAVTNAPTAEVMPLIVINDAPLPDAIGNLARQAGINIQFDPNALKGPVDPKTGVAQPPPNVTFHWENVTAKEALQALLENYGLQLVEDKRKIARVTVKEPNALEPLVPRVITLKYSQSQVTNLIPMVKAVAGPRGQVLADLRTGQLVVLATESDIVKVEELITKLDISPSQILIEARFMETVKNPRSAKGIDWTGTLANHQMSFGNNSFFTEGLEPKAPTPTTPEYLGRRSGVLADPKAILSTADGFGPIGFLNTEGLNAVISFLNTDNQTETISTPRTVALEGVPTELSVVQNVPIFEEEQGSTSSGVQQASTVKPNYNLSVSGNILNEVGTKLIVTPRIYGGSNVFLDLKPELSEVGPDAVATLGGKVNTAPTFIRKKIQTQAMVPTGATLVLGGLQEDRNNKTRTKVPLLGDIPGLGRAFRSDLKEKNKRQLLIFVTPTILGADDFVPAEESGDFLRQKGVELPDVEWGDYDSTTPKDWTKPVE